MDQKCSYEYCPGSPRNSCSCNNSNLYCEEHLARHLTEEGEHSPRPPMPADPTSSSKLLAKEMKDISKAIGQVMVTGKGMFKEICRKLCKITDDLTERQEKLIQMASNLSESPDLPKESFKELGDLGLKFRSREDFSKLIDEHFSKDSAKVDFSLFAEDFKNITSHLDRSNKLLEEVRETAEKEAKFKEEMNRRMSEVEEFKTVFSKKVEDKIAEIETGNGNRARDNGEIIDELNKKLDNALEQMDKQRSIIEEVHKKYLAAADGIKVQNDSNLAYSLKVEGLISKVEKNLNSKVNKTIADIESLRENIEKCSKESKDLTEARFGKVDKDTKACLDELRNKFNTMSKELKDFAEGKVKAAENRFKVSCDEIKEQIRKAVKDSSDLALGKVNKAENDAKAGLDSLRDLVAKMVKEVKDFSESRAEKTEKDSKAALDGIRDLVGKMTKDTRDQMEARVAKAEKDNKDGLVGIRDLVGKMTKDTRDQMEARVAKAEKDNKNGFDGIRDLVGKMTKDTRDQMEARVAKAEKDSKAGLDGLRDLVGKMEKETKEHAEFRVAKAEKELKNLCDLVKDQVVRVDNGFSQRVRSEINSFESFKNELIERVFIERTHRKKLGFT